MPDVVLTISLLARKLSGQADVFTKLLQRQPYFGEPDQATRFTFRLIAGAIAVVVSGCSTTILDPTAEGDVVNQVQQVTGENVNLKESISRLERDLSSRDARLRDYEGRLSVAAGEGGSQDRRMLCARLCPADVQAGFEDRFEA